MSETWNFVLGLLVLVLFFLLLAWVIWRALQNSDDPKKLAIKLAITGVLVFIKIKFVVPVALTVPLVGVPAAALLAIIIGGIWASSWGSMLAKPLTSAFDGGDEEPEQKPIYSPAEAKRRRNQFREAIEDIRQQLAKFPNDFHGQFLMAEIQAQDLNDLQGAQVTINRLLQQRGHAPANTAAALHAMADWHLKYGQDPQSAREALERIPQLLPNTQFAQTAAQRIAHLSSIDQLMDSHDRRKIELGTYDQFIGLRKPAEQSQTPETPAANVAAELVKHLEQHPLDTESREELAIIYAEQYNRVDLARNELEHLISMPNQPTKRVVHWLNLLTELQVKYSNDVDAGRETLRRIMEKFPRTAYAHQAQTRMAYLKLETRKNEKSQVVELGSYEKYLGLAEKKMSKGESANAPDKSQPSPEAS